MAITMLLITGGNARLLKCGDFVFNPTYGFGTERDLLWKTTSIHLAVNERTRKAGAVFDGRQAKKAKRFSHWGMLHNKDHHAYARRELWGTRVFAGPPTT
jgi:hypothetical protein